MYITATLLPTKIFERLNPVLFIVKEMLRPALDVNFVETVEHELVESLVSLEAVLPRSELSILQHLLIHFPGQMRELGPAHYSWMYGKERYHVRITFV